MNVEWLNLPFKDNKKRHTANPNLSLEKPRNESKMFLYIPWNLEGLNPHSTISPPMVARSLSFFSLDRCKMFSHTSLVLSHLSSSVTLLQLKMRQKNPTCCLKNQVQRTFSKSPTTSPYIASTRDIFGKCRDTSNISKVSHYFENDISKCSTRQCIQYIWYIADIINIASNPREFSIIKTSMNMQQTSYVIWLLTHSQ